MTQYGQFTVCDDMTQDGQFTLCDDMTQYGQFAVCDDMIQYGQFTVCDMTQYGQFTVCDMTQFVSLPNLNSVWSKIYASNSDSRCRLCATSPAIIVSGLELVNTTTYEYRSLYPVVCGAKNNVYLIKKPHRGSQWRQARRRIPIYDANARTFPERVSSSFPCTIARGQSHSRHQSHAP